jgi:hypothetical protein
MEIEQRYIVSSLHSKGMKLPTIVAELAAIYHEDAFDENILPECQILVLVSIPAVLLFVPALLFQLCS